MGKKVRIQLASVDRDRLEALIANGNTPQKHARRAQLVLLAGDGIGTNEIQRRLRVSKPTIRRWRTRYVEAGLDGLCRDKTRPPGKPPLGAAVVSRVIAKTKTETPPDATHWSLRTMAKAVGIAPSSVQAIWKAHGLKPHREGRGRGWPVSQPAGTRHRAVEVPHGRVPEKTFPAMACVIAAPTSPYRAVCVI